MQQDHWLANNVESDKLELREDIVDFFVSVFNLYLSDYGVRSDGVGIGGREMSRGDIVVTEKYSENASLSHIYYNEDSFILGVHKDKWSGANDSERVHSLIMNLSYVVEENKNEKYWEILATLCMDINNDTQYILQHSNARWETVIAHIFDQIPSSKRGMYESATNYDREWVNTLHHTDPRIEPLFSPKYIDHSFVRVDMPSDKSLVEFYNKIERNGTLHTREIVGKPTNSGIQIIENKVSAALLKRMNRDVPVTLQ